MKLFKILKGTPVLMLDYKNCSSDIVICKVDTIFEREDLVEENNGLQPPEIKNFMCVPSSEEALNLLEEVLYLNYKFELKQISKEKGYTTGHTTKYVGRHILVATNNVQYVG